MKRKLPPDSEVWALHASGLTYKEIASRHSVNVMSVQAAMDRWRDKSETAQKRIKASTPDPTFVRAGKQPTAHRDTGDGGAAADLREAYKRQPLQIHECADLLREWGVAS